MYLFPGYYYLLSAGGSIASMAWRSRSPYVCRLSSPWPGWRMVNTIAHGSTRISTIEYCQSCSQSSMQPDCPMPWLRIGSQPEQLDSILAFLDGSLLFDPDVLKRCCFRLARELLNGLASDPI